MTNDELHGIVKMYSNAFGIKHTVTQEYVILYFHGTMVGRLELHSPKIFNYKNENGWSKCRTSDLLSLILHNCPLHGVKNVLRL